MKIKDKLRDDEYIEESDWETEIELACEDAEEWGISFFIVFEDRTMARANIAEVSEVIDEWKRNIPLS